MQGNVRFIRKGGRVIPIHVDSSQGLKGNAKANMPVVKKAAIEEARDQYHSRASEQIKSTASKVFTFATAAAAAGGAGLGAKFLIDKASQGVDKYHAVASAKSKQYGAIGIAGGISAGAGVAHMASRAHNIITGAKAMGLPATAGDLAKAIVSTKMSKVSIGAAIIGSGAAAIGAYGYSKAQGHLRRATALKKATSALKSFANGDVSNLDFNIG